VSTREPVLGDAHHSQVWSNTAPGTLNTRHGRVCRHDHRLDLAGDAVRVRHLRTRKLMSFCNAIYVVR
jgi:hypothetical protein